MCIKMIDRNKDIGITYHDRGNGVEVRIPSLGFDISDEIVVFQTPQEAVAFARGVVYSTGQKILFDNMIFRHPEFGELNAV